MDTTDLAFAPDGRTLASAGWDRTVKLWDAATGRQLRTLQGHSDSVLAVSFSPTAQWLASVGYDGTMRFWGGSSAGADSRVREKEPTFMMPSIDEVRHAVLATHGDLVPGDRRWDSPRSATILDLARLEQVYAKLLELRPNDGHLWTGRGRYHALRDRWDKAAADFARGIASAPPESEEWFEHACLRLIVGDREGYRAFVRGMRQRAGWTDDSFAAYVLARSCILAADPVVEPGQVVRWAEHAVAGDRNPWYLHALGAAHYRAGHLDEAIARLEESNAGTWTEGGKAQNRLVLALAYQWRGNLPQARVELEEVTKWWEGLEAAKTGDAIAMSTTDWLPLQVLRREAEAVVLHDPVFPADPFAR
jgi:tetratricopeptide (TPR) repeat protein